MAALTYASKNWGIKKLKIMEMKCLRSMCDAIRFDRARKEEVKRRVAVRESLSDRMDQKILN